MNAQAEHAVQEAKPRALGLAAMAIASFALILAVAHLNFGPFAPQKPAEEVVVETVMKLRDAAARALAGEKVEEVEVAPARQWDIDQVVQAGVFGLAAFAIIFALIALMRNEQQSPAFFGFSLGAGVLMIAWLQWIALIICGVIFLAIVVNLVTDLTPSI